MELIKVLYKNTSYMVLSKHIDLINMCGAYAAAKYLKRCDFSINYAMACLQQSKFNRSI